VLIDQEGGRVARLRAPHWWGGVAAARIGALPAGEAEEAAFLSARVMAADMATMGVDVDCAPCLDLLVAGANNVIGDRSFGADAERVAALGQANVDGFLAGGVVPVIKHLPGCGRVRTDPHDVLPVIDCPLETMAASDFKPFAAIEGMPWGMTNHAVYSAVDPDCVATLSAKVIAEIIRGAIGFDGLLVSDALDMDALSGSHAERARLAIAAGCDLAMHCNQPLDVRREVADAVPELSNESLRRLKAADAMRQAPDPAFNRQAALARLGELVGEAVA
jgi:beta-N-acetylhexosaminidase